MTTEFITRDIDGQRVLFVVPALPDEAPPRLREGLARRRVLYATGRCPCGATFEMPNRATRRAARKTGAVLHGRVTHEDDCPATDDACLDEIARWAP
jgi:hypothetical protein